MKMKYIDKVVPLAMAVLSLTACGDFLDKEPSKNVNTPIKTANQLQALLDNTSKIREENVFAFYANDDDTIPMGMYDVHPTTFADVSKYYMLSPKAIENDNSDDFWEQEYAKIYDANVAINSIGEVTGSDAEKNAVLADACFMRAWSFFTMAVYYCRPYCEANKQELGLPLRLGTDFQESLKRATLEETFAQIMSDLDRAAELCPTSRAVADARWRVTPCAVNAFYARLYLYMGDYDKALSYATAALKDAPELYDYNNFKAGRTLSYDAYGDMPAQEVIPCETNDWSMQDIYKFQEFIYIRMAYNPYQFTVPSNALLSLYDHDSDLRFKWFYNIHGNRRMNIPYECYRYNYMDDGEYSFSGLSTAETMLCQAECLVRTGQWQQGMEVVNTLRANRYATGSNYTLTATSQADALKKVLEERRRECAFGMRMYDVKRLAVNSDGSDDARVRRTFYTVSTNSIDTSTTEAINLSGDDKRMALPINIYDINASQGQIEQNPVE